jgi:hypothetical protein
MQESNLFKKGVNFPPPPVADGNTLLLLNPSDGVIKDLSSRNAVVTAFNVSVDNVNTLFGSPTMKFNTYNPGNYLSIPSPAYMAVGTGDWTIDLYYNTSDVPARPSDSTRHSFFGYWGQPGGGSNPLNLDLEYLEDSYGFSSLYGIAWATTATSFNIINPPIGKVVRNTWHYMAAQVRSGVFTWRVDGKLIAAAASPGINISQRVVRPFYVGYSNDSDSLTNGWYYQGHMAWWRFSNIARYPNT